MSDATASKRRKRWPRVVGIAVVGLAVIVLAAPTILSWTIAPSLVAGAVSGAVNGTVSVSATRLGWTSPQRIEGLVIDDRANGTRISATVEVKRSLLSFITSPMGAYEVVARADVVTTMGADGTLGLAKLARSPAAPGAGPGTGGGASPGAGPAPSPPAPLPGTLAASITLEPSSFEIVRGADGPIKVSSLAGTARFDASDGSITSDLRGQISGDGSAAPFALSSRLKGVVDRFGAFAPGAATGVVKAAANGFGTKIDGTTAQLAGLDLSIDAVDASTPIGVIFSVRRASFGESEISDFGGSAHLGRDAKGPAGLSASSLSAAIERGSITVRGGDEPFTASGLGATVTLGAGGAASFTLAAETAIGARHGSVSGQGAFERLFDASFSPTPAAATGRAEIKVSRAVIPAGPVLSEIEQLDISIDARDASAPISMRADGSGTVRELAAAPGGSARATGTPERSSVVVALSMARDPGSGVGVSTDPQRISGSVEAKGIPSAIVAPFLPRDGAFRIVPSRDLGPTLGITATAPGGASAPITLALDSQRLRANLRATIDAGTGSITNASATASATLAPELLEPAALRPAGPLATTIEITSFSLPRGDRGFDLAALQVDAKASAQGSVALGSADAPITITAAQASLLARRLGDGADLKLNAVADGIPAEVVASLGGLQGIGGGAFEPRSISARGTLAAGPVDWQRPSPWLAALPFKGVEHGLKSSVIAASFDGHWAQGAAQLKVTDGQQSAGATLAWTAEKVTMSEGRANLVVTNPSLASLGVDSLLLARPASIEGSLAPLAFERPALEQGRVEIDAMTFSLRAPEIALAKAPGVARPVTVNGLDASGTMRPANDFGIESRASLSLADASGPIGAAALRFDGTRLAAEARRWSASIDAKELEGSRLLALLDLHGESIPGVSPGDRGTLSLSARSEESGSLAAQFDAAIGAVRGKGSAVRASNGAISIPGAEIAMTLDAQRSSAFFDNEKDANGRPLIPRASAVPIAVSLENVSIPPPGSDGAMPVLLSSGHAKFTTGNVDLEVAQIGTVRVGAIDADLTLAGRGQRANLRLSSTVSHSSMGTQPVSIQGVLANFADADGSFDFVKSSLDGVVKMQGMPVAMLDLVLPGDGIFTQALGPSLFVDGRALSVPGSAGTTLSGTAKSQFMDATLGRIQVDQGWVEVAPPHPLSLSLVPNGTLRQRLLKPINPILEDIRPKADQPVTFAVNELRAPADFSMGDLNSRFVLTIGDIEIQRNDRMLDLLRLVREDADGLIDGNVGPLNGVIEDGRLSYENFVISLGRTGNSWNQQLFFSGDVNLASTPPYATAINVDYPLSGIGKLAAGATRFDGFFSRVGQILDRVPVVDLNSLRVRATFSGPIEPDRDLDMAFEPVLIAPDGSTDPVKAILGGLFGESGIIRLPGRGGTSGGSGSGGTGGQGGTGGDQPSKPGDPIRGILDDIFKKKN